MSKMVITIDGTEAPKNECRKIGGVYYKIGDNKIENSGHCYLINDKYYKFNTGYIVYDHYINEYVIKNSSILVEKGVIDIVDNVPVFGSFSKYDEEIILNYGGTKYYCLTEEIFSKTNRFREKISNGEYYDIKDLSIKEMKKIKRVDQNYKRSLPYNSSDVLKESISTFEKYSKKDIKQSNAEKILLKVLGDLSFGLEFETVTGTIPERYCKKVGLIPLRDGSIEGIEYVTIPLSGKEGVNALSKGLDLLSERTTYNTSCSIHMHIGNLPRTPEFITALFRVISKLEDEFYGMYPLYKKYNFGIKRKNYTKPLPVADLNSMMDLKINKDNITENFDKIFTYLAGGRTFKEYKNSLSNVEAHPNDPNGTSKWYVKTRYHWFNFIPLIFGNKTTVEFRMQTPTYDKYKVLGMLGILAAVIQYTKTNQTLILNNWDSNQIINISLRTIIDDFYYRNESRDMSKLAGDLKNLVKSRTQYTSSLTRDKGVSFEESEINLKNTYLNKYLDW